MRIRRLRRAELPADTVELARWLIGRLIVHDTPHGRLAGRIVETEAYPPGDEAAHSFIGKTTRNASLFLKRGHAYVYFSYGVHWLFNVSSGIAGEGCGVLVRGLEPLIGIDRPTDGPGKLTVALQIDRRFDGIDLCAREVLWLGAIAGAPPPIEASVRIGISKAVDRRWRFFERENTYVSRRLRSF